MNKQTNQIIVEVVDDNSIAILKFLPYELADGFIINEKIVGILIRQKGINNIKWGAIKKAVDQVLKTKQPLANLIISKATDVPLKIFQNKISVDYSLEKMANLAVILTNLNEILQEKIKDDRLLPAFFYSEKEIIFEFNFPRKIDVYGNEKIEFNEKYSLAINESIESELLKDKVIYKAKESGYLIVDANNKFGIHNPLRINEDETQLSLNYYPITRSIDAFERFLNTVKNKYKIEIMPGISQFKSPELRSFILKEGIKPIYGKNAEINWHFTTKIIEKLNLKDKLKFDEIIPYKKIGEGTLIAIKTIYIPGKNGINIFGEILPVNFGQDIIISSDENIKTTEIDGCIHYHSAIEGVFFKINNSISIENAFFLESDVDSTTGDIIHDGAVVIIGNIKLGRTVKCKRKLSIIGSVENKCNISCDGDISISYGVEGERTNVHAKGYCEVGYVVDAKIIASKGLVVYKYAHNSNLFSRGKIEIKGNSTKSNKCSLIGGVINSLVKVEAFSVGSIEFNTKIILGKDLYAEKLIYELKQGLVNLNIKIGRLNKSLSYLNSTENTNTDLSLPQTQDKLKTLLLEISEVEDYKNKIKLAIIENEKLLFIDDPYRVEFIVFNQVVPHVYVFLNNYNLHLDSEIKSEVLVALVNNNLCLLNHDRTSKVK